jgi:hypothetical protein
MIVNYDRKTFIVQATGHLKSPTTQRTGTTPGSLPTGFEPIIFNVTKRSVPYCVRYCGGPRVFP